MARAGILYSDVAKAATALAADGKRPTVDGVRDALGGTGSKSTIAPFLKRWKAEHQDQLVQAEAGLSPSLLVAVKGLHQHMQAEFEQKLEQARQQHGESLRAATEREQQLARERDATAAANSALKEELGRTKDALAQLQEHHHAQSVTLATAHADNAGLQWRLADRAAEVTTLDHQLTQARAQFEHYQEATAAQRAEERHAYEQHIARLEQDLAGANQHIAAQQSTLGQQEAKLIQLAAENERDAQALQAAQAELAAVRSERDRLAGRLDDATIAKEGMAAQLLTAQQQLTETRMALAAKEREVTLLAEQIRRTEERAESLASEKIDLLQVRAALEQQLRQAAKPPSAMLQGSRKSD